MPRVKYIGFTLIELLVVVAIIVVLIAILLPSLGRARQQTQSVTCMSNLRQIGVGMFMYAQDNNNWIPCATNNEGQANQTSWDQLLTPYILSSVEVTNGGLDNMTSTKTTQNIYRCQADVAERKNNLEFRSYSRILFQKIVEGTPDGYGTFEDYTQPIKLTEITAQSSTFLVMEWHHKGNVLGGNWRSWITYNYFKDYSNPVMALDENYTPSMGTFHMGTASNFLFFDGHAEQLIRAEAIKFYEHWKKN